MDGVWCSRLLDVASVQSVSLVVDVSTSAVSLTDDSGYGLRADVSQLQTTLSLKSPSANSESSLFHRHHYHYHRRLKICAVPITE